MNDQAGTEFTRNVLVIYLPHYFVLCFVGLGNTSAPKYFVGAGVKCSHKVQGVAGSNLKARSNRFCVDKST